MDLRINYKQAFLIIIDTFSLAAAYYLALLLRFDSQIPIHFQRLYWESLIYLISLSILIFYVLGLYARVWKYAGTEEVLAVVYAVTAANTMAYLFTSLWQPTLPRSVYLISWFLNVAFIGGVRFLLRLRRQISFRSKEAAARVLIYGAGDAGMIVLDEFKRQYSEQKKLPVGFIDDSPAKLHGVVRGLKVMGARERIPELVSKHNIDEIIIAIRSLSAKEVRQIAFLCKQFPVKLQIFSGVENISNGAPYKSKIRPIELEDLLCRDEVKINLGEIFGYIKGETVLVTGAGGSIGSELCRQVVALGPSKILLLDHAENSIYDIEMELCKLSTACTVVPIVADVREKKRIDQVFASHKPSVIFHAAAHKHVPLMEVNREEAIRNNIFGTKNVAEAADRYNAKSFLLVSTDKAVNPTSVMGATKRVAEMAIQILAKKSKTRYCAVRFGNVLGSRGSVIPLFKQQIEAGGPVTVTHPEMTRYFMTIPEAVQLVIQAGAMGQKGEIFVLNMGEPVKIIDLAHDLIRLSGLEPDKDICITYSGIRPGEKIFEEVLTVEECSKKTTHQRIFIASATEQGSASFVAELAHIKKILLTDFSGFGDVLPFPFNEHQASRL